MKRYTGSLSVLLFVGVISAVAGRTCPAKTVHGLCKRDVDANLLTFDFRLNLQTSPAGSLQVYPPDNAVTNPCPIALIGTVYQVSVNVDLGTRREPTGQNGCGFTYSNGAYTWQFMYYELAGRTDIDGGCNRLYTAVCDPTNMVDNVVTAQVAVTTPNLNTNVNPYKPNVEYYIVAETQPGSNTYVRLNQGDQVPVQTNMKLRLVYRYGTYNPNRVSQIGGLRTLVDSTTQFSNPRLFFNDNGCPASSIAPGSNYGFRYVAPTEAGTSVRESAVFPAFLFDQVNSQLIAFTTRVEFCYGQPGSDLFCYDPCNNPRTRKRRQTPDETAEVTTSIRVVDVTVKSKQSSDENGTLVYAVVGACIGVCVLLIVLLVVLLCMVRRDRQRKAASEKVPPTVFVNDITASY